MTRAIMNEGKRVEWFGAVLSLLYEFNWAMTETEIMQRSMKFRTSKTCVWY